MKRILHWLVVAGMLLSLLPATAGAASSAVPLWNWTTAEDSLNDATRTAYIAKFASNVVNETESAGNGYFFGTNTQNTVYNADGPFKLKTFGFRSGVHTESATGLHYGVPYRTTENGYKVPREALCFYLGGSDHSLNLDTTGYEAINIDFTYIDDFSVNNNMLAYCRSMEVYVMVNGQWLSDSVGIRTTRLLGGGIVVQASSYSGQVYELRTENLLDIDGLNAGDTIQNIKVVPEGTDTRPAGKIAFSDITVNGYTTKAAWDASVEERETIPMTEDALRALVVEEAVRTANLTWVPKQDIQVTAQAGGSGGSGTGTTSRTYKAGYTYHGPVYNREVDATREQIEAAIADGSYGAAMDDYQKMPGMDCQTFVFNATSRVSQNFGWAAMFIPGAPGMTMLGEDFLTTSKTQGTGQIRFTDEDVVALNSQTEMSRAYALLKPGDVLNKYCGNENNSVHVRLVQEVNAEQGYVLCAESHSSMYYKMTDGSTVEDSGLSVALLLGKTVDYGYTVSAGNKYTFAELYEDSYVPYTLDAYTAGSIEKEDVEAVFSPKQTGKSIRESGLHLSVASNYRIIGYTVKLEGAQTGELFSDTVSYENDPINVGFNYESAQLDAVMAGLTAVDTYTLSVDVESGPLTASGVKDVPVTTMSKSFTISEQESAYLDLMEAKPVCGEDHSGWTELTSDGGTLAEGKYYLTGDTTVGSQLKSASGTVDLCLNGYTLTIPSSFSVSGSTLNICDCSASGTGQLKISTATSGRVVTVSTGGTVNLYGGTLTAAEGKTKADGRGVNVNKSGAVFNMLGGSISDCHTASSSYEGGGVYIVGGATFNMYDGVISNCSSATAGGGVYVTGTFNMYGGTISGNTAGTVTTDADTEVVTKTYTTTQLGGAVRNAGTFNMYGGTIGPDNSAYSGGAVYNTQVFVMTGGTITGNTAGPDGGTTGQGGGVDNRDGTFALAGGTISANHAGKYGGGVYTNGTFTMSGDSVIRENTCATTGGGVFHTATANFIMNGGTITLNEAANNGGGVHNGNGFTMNGGTISENTAGNQGGGVNNASGTFTMNGGTISENEAKTGGGVYTGKAFTMTDGVITGNTATTATGIYEGGGTVAISGGVLDNAFARNAGTAAFSGGRFRVENTTRSYLAEDDAYLVKVGTFDRYPYAKYEVVKGLACSGAHIRFGSSLNVSLPLASDNGFSVDESYAVTLSAGSGKQYTYTVEDLALSTEVSVAAVTVQGIAAKEMRDTITVTVKKGDVTYYTDNLSVYALAKGWYDDPESTIDKTMLADMLNYGAAAQEEFEYGTVSDEPLTGTQNDPVWTALPNSGVSGDNGAKIAYTLSLKDKIQLNVYIDDVNATISEVTFKGSDYAAYTRTTRGTGNKTITLVSFGQIDVVDADEQVSFTVTPSDGGEAYTVTYSIRDYVVNALGRNQDAVLKALQKYVDSVSAYISANS